MADKMRAQHEISHGKFLATAADTEKMWGWNTPAGEVRARRRAALIAAASGLSRGMRVLEIGCGTGMFTEIFSASGADITAVDISPDLLRLARNRNVPEERVRFVEARFENMDPGGSYDAIIGSSVLHHLEIEPALTKIHDLLRPGGVMSFAEPNMLNPQVFLERKLSFIRPLFSYVSPDETAFVRGRLAKMLSAAGFEAVSITPFDWLHPAVPRSMIAFVSKVGGWLERTPVLREFSGSLCIRARRPL